MTVHDFRFTAIVDAPVLLVPLHTNASEHIRDYQATCVSSDVWLCIPMWVWLGHIVSQLRLRQRHFGDAPLRNGCGHPSLHCVHAEAGHALRSPPRAAYRAPHAGRRSALRDIVFCLLVFKPSQPKCGKAFRLASRRERSEDMNEEPASPANELSGQRTKRKHGNQLEAAIKVETLARKDIRKHLRASRRKQVRL